MNKTWLTVLAGAILIAAVGFGVNQIFAGDKAPALTAEEAVQKAEERYPGSVKEIELNDTSARAVYEIELEGPGGNYEVHMDANSGEILKVEQGHRPKERKTAVEDHQENLTDDIAVEDGSEERTKEEPRNGKRISYKKAKKIALSEFDGKVKDIELDKDDGRWIYEVKIKNGKEKAELEIDAFTGETLLMSVEYDD
ncbi:PepSY domain-containing protein [Desmospora profundinema]|uniref:Membrane protein YkoI n=1 Tax=Desmospora profundinema TaxID=1571184 RepID=A0ABU1ISC1_9BACL|nr:PepSY domain-containing protein [Desmospora profundinema]MDR6227640.1 putative membrane protein YkoI [Desmospora profundinema]